MISPLLPAIYFFLQLAIRFDAFSVSRDDQCWRDRGDHGVKLEVTRRDESDAVSGRQGVDSKASQSASLTKIERFDHPSSAVSSPLSSPRPEPPVAGL